MASNVIANMALADFLTSASTKLFRSMDISTEFLMSDLAGWHATRSYASTVRRVEVLLVVIDLLLVPCRLVRRVVA